MKTFLSAVAAGMLVACTATEPVDLELKFAERCAARGYEYGTAAFDACADDEKQQFLLKRAAGRVY